jgi:2-dehydropantoate 2-reductase
MYQDLLRERRLELPWLSGFVAGMGEQLGIPVPCNMAVSDILALYIERKGIMSTPSPGGGLRPLRAQYA